MWLLTDLDCSLFSRIRFLSVPLSAVFPMHLVSTFACCSWFQRQKTYLAWKQESCGVCASGVRTRVRAPPSTLLSHTESCLWTCFEGCSIANGILCGWVSGTGPPCAPGAPSLHLRGSNTAKKRWRGGTGTLLLTARGWAWAWCFRVAGSVVTSVVPAVRRGSQGHAPARERAGKYVTENRQSTIFLHCTLQKQMKTGLEDWFPTYKHQPNEIIECFDWLSPSPAANEAPHSPALPQGWGSRLQSPARARPAAQQQASGRREAAKAKGWLWTLI